MDSNNKGSKKGLLWFGFISGIGCFPIIILLLSLTAVVLILVFFNHDDDSSSYSGICRAEGSVDMNSFSATLAKAGVFAGMEDTFIEVANKNEIDPVLLAAIALHETGYGKSNLVKTKNNPGGLYNSKAGTFYSFDSLEEGLDAMGKVLHKHVVINGLNTIEKLGNVYAPVGAANDPNNLNSNWIPTVTDIANKLGGLTMNCEAQSMGGSFLIPTTNGFHINSNYGWRDIGDGPEFHEGLDLKCALGESALAAKEGKVVQSKLHNSLGNYVAIQHDDGYITLYGHLSKRIVSVGDTVSAGQVIGLCGSTGRSTGPHLHFAVKLPNGQYTDPYPFLVGNSK